jgi:hypothetical protein
VTELLGSDFEPRAALDFEFGVAALVEARQADIIQDVEATERYDTDHDGTVDLERTTVIEGVP